MPDAAEELYHFVTLENVRNLPKGSMCGMSVHLVLRTRFESAFESDRCDRISDTRRRCVRGTIVQQEGTSSLKVYT